MSIKQGRMEDRILAILSELLRREVSDPRLHNITFTEVKLDGEDVLIISESDILGIVG